MLTASLPHSVVICDSFVEKEPRVIKEIQALKDAGIIPVIISYSKGYPGAVCYDLSEIDNDSKHLSYPLVIRKATSLYKRLSSPIINVLRSQTYFKDKLRARRIFKAIDRNVEYKHVIAHHMPNLPTSSYLADMLNTRLIFNAHEFYPEQFTGTKGWDERKQRLIKIGNDFLHKCDKIFNVCEGIQNRYEKDFNLKKGIQVLVTNATPYKELKPSTVCNKIRLIHHGVANGNRRLDLMISVIDLVDKDRFEFYFMLVPNQYHIQYYDYMKEEIDKRKNCFLLSPVSTEEISNRINEFDIGFYMYDNSYNFNMQHYLPNKLYEFIQARLGVVIGPYVEMKKVVEEYKIGYVANENTVEVLAEVINGLTIDDVVRIKANADIAAPILAGENEIAKMTQVFKEL